MILYMYYGRRLQALHKILKMSLLTFFLTISRRSLQINIFYNTYVDDKFTIYNCLYLKDSCEIWARNEQLNGYANIKHTVVNRTRYHVKGTFSHKKSEIVALQ
jgi:hypothetical protein